MALASPPTPAAPRMFGRFELRQMLGRSLASSTWLAFDPRLKQDVMLCVPRVQPASPAERLRWGEDTQQSSRLNHPRLAEVLEQGNHEGWPFVTCVRGGGISLAERLQLPPAPTAFEVANWTAQLLEGLAYAHEAGMAHLDIGLHNVLASVWAWHRPSPDTPTSSPRLAHRPARAASAMCSWSAC